MLYHTHKSTTMAWLVFVLLLCVSSAQARDAPSERPVVKRPKSAFKTLLSVDFGGTRNIMASIVLVEMEHAIKRYLLSHPEHLSENAGEDFSVELVDYFDVITGGGGGGWIALYLSSRGGKGFSKTVLSDPTIIKKYGVIQPGSAEGLIVFFKEYSTVIYPPTNYNLTAGTPFDLSNPLATGVATPVHSNDGIITAMEAFVGNASLKDLDTTVLIPTFDLISLSFVMFMSNFFGDVPTIGTAKLNPRFSPRLATEARFKPDAGFSDGDYFLKDVAAATGSLPFIFPAHPVSRVDNDTTEFLCIEGDIAIDSPAAVAAYFTIALAETRGYEDLAIVSLGPGTQLSDWVSLADAGLAGWISDFSLLRFFPFSSTTTADGLLDLVFYSNPHTKPYQYIRIDASAPSATDVGRAFGSFDQEVFFPIYEAAGYQLAEDFRQPIDIYVRDFIFG